MPLTATANYKAEIGKRRIRMAAKATVTLPGAALLDITGAITDVRLSCSMATPLPAGVRAPSGDTTLDGDITLSGSVVVSGQTMTVADLFDRYNQASPLWRMNMNDCKVVYQIGPRIRGQVDANGKPLIDYKTMADTWINGYSVDRAAGTVTFTLTDVPPTWDQTPAIPPVITDSPFNAAMTSEFAMDRLIRQMDGVSSWPAQRAQCVLAAGFRSSLWAEVGTFQSASAVPTFKRGVFGSAVASNVANIYQLASSIGRNAFVQFWTTGLTSGGAGTTAAFGWLDSISGQLDNAATVTVTAATTTVTVQGGTASFSIALNSGPHCVELAVALPAVGGTASSGTVWIDGTAHAFSITGSVARPADAYNLASFAVDSNSTFEAWQVTTETSPTANGSSFYPHFVCDTSLNPLTAVPAIDKGTAPWDELETMAAAECGLIQRIPDSNDPSGGQLRFTNRLTLIGYDPTRGRTITSLDSLKAYTDATPASAAIRTVEVPYSEWDFGSPSLVWSASARKRIKANQTISWKQKLPDGALAASIDTTVALAPVSGNVNDGGSYYLVSGNASGSVAYNGTLNITLTLVSPDTVLVTVQEPNGQDAWLSVPGTYSGPITAGSPALWIGGVPATVGQEALARTSVGSGLGVLSVSSNAYSQDHDTALGLSQFLASQLSNDVDQFDGVDIVPDGTILCGDLEHVTDQYGHLDDYMLVWGFSHEASWQPGQPATFGMTADLRPVGPPGSWLIGYPGRSEIGTTTYVYAAS